MYKHILYATDLRDDHPKAEKQAFKLAKAAGAKLALVHVIEPIQAYGYPGSGDLQAPLIDYARKMMAKLGTHLQIGLPDQHIEFGSVKAAVLAVAEKIKADLIVVGSHDRHGLGRLLGSGAQAVANHAKCDVLIVHC